MPVERHQHRKQQRHGDGVLVNGHADHDERSHCVRNNCASKRAVVPDKLSAMPLRDKTNAVVRDEVDAVPPRIVSTHCDAAKDRGGQRQQEHAVREHRHGQRLVEPTRDLETQHGSSQSNRSHPLHRQPTIRNHEKPAKLARNEEAWKEQCCDALAV